MTSQCVNPSHTTCVIMSFFFLYIGYYFIFIAILINVRRMPNINIYTNKNITMLIANVTNHKSIVPHIGYFNTIKNHWTITLLRVINNLQSSWTLGEHLASPPHHTIPCHNKASLIYTQYSIIIWCNVSLMGGQIAYLDQPPISCLPFRDQIAHGIFSVLFTLG